MMAALNSIWAIARTTVVEQIRNRLYLIILFFGALILAASILLGSLAPGHKVRVIFDLGAVALEMFGLLTAVFGAVTLILQEIESKTIYLILTRPIHRGSYIFGRFLGLIAAVVITMLVMAGLHVLIMVSDRTWFTEFTRGWSFWAVYPAVVATSVFKMMVTTAVALFFSLFATSAVSALVFTVFFWVAGHFGPELAFMVERSTQSGIQLLGKAVIAILPNFQFLNFRDTYAVPGFPGFEFLGWALLYTAGYAGVCLFLSALLFARKEF